MKDHIEISKVKEWGEKTNFGSLKVRTDAIQSYVYVLHTYIKFTTTEFD